MIDFVFNETIEKELEEGKLHIRDLEKDEISLLKGYTTDTGDILINLSASQWKTPNEEFVINELTKTIIHETVHMINNCGGKDEKACQILAGQL